MEDLLQLVNKENMTELQGDILAIRNNNIVIFQHWVKTESSTLSFHFYLGRDGIVAVDASLELVAGLGACRTNSCTMYLYKIREADACLLIWTRSDKWSDQDQTQKPFLHYLWTKL